MHAHAAQCAARHSSLGGLPCRLDNMVSAVGCLQGEPMSSIAEELDVTSEANLLFIGLMSSTDHPHPDAPEHANVRIAFAALFTSVCCSATCPTQLKPALALPPLDNGQPDADPAACSGFTTKTSMRKCCLTSSVTRPTCSAAGSCLKGDRRLQWKPSGCIALAAGSTVPNPAMQCTTCAAAACM